MWIALEGIDGAGKRTQADLLRARFEQEGRTAAVVSFPRYGQTRTAAEISVYLSGRRGALHTVDPKWVALLYALDRTESREYLQELSATHDVLILDRYVASNLAYQGARFPAGEERQAFITWLAGVEYNDNAMPPVDLTLFLDVAVGASAGNVARRGTADIHEADRAYLDEVRLVYFALFGWPMPGHALEGWPAYRPYRCDQPSSVIGGPWEGTSCMEGGYTGPNTVLRSVEAIHADLWDCLQHAGLLTPR